MDLKRFRAEQRTISDPATPPAISHLIVVSTAADPYHEFTNRFGEHSANFGASHGGGWVFAAEREIDGEPCRVETWITTTDPARRERMTEARIAAGERRIIAEHQARNTPEAWQVALREAHDRKMTLRQIDFGPVLAFVPGRKASLTYQTDGIECVCPRAVDGNPVCSHRALFREHVGTLVLDEAVTHDA